MWASTERRRVNVLRTTMAAARADWVQVTRLGNPLINEVIIPIGLKDKYNRTAPGNDRELRRRPR